MCLLAHFLTVFNLHAKATTMDGLLSVVEVHSLLLGLFENQISCLDMIYNKLHLSSAEK